MNSWFLWLKKHFIPHEGNNQRPHILRSESIRAILVVILFLEIFSFLIPTLTRINLSDGMAAVLPAVLDDLTNAERQSQHLEVLTVSPILNEAAQMKALDMATLGYFAHTSPEGKTPWYWIEKVGYKYQYAGENLAVNFSDSQDVTNAWMNSPTHKANIVKGNYTEIGTGVATGIYQGKQSIFVAQVYANPLPKTFLPTKPIKTEVKQSVKISGITEKDSMNVLAAETVNTNPDRPVSVPTFWQKLLASPRNTTDKILVAIFAIIVLALLLYIIIKLRNHHKDLITNGLFVLAVIGAIILANQYISYRNMVISDSFDYSIDSK